MKMNILILSHGRFCEEIVKSSEMIVGNNPNLYTLPLLTEDDSESYGFKLNKKIESFGNIPFLILVDVVGGTPFNCSMKLLKKYDFCIVTGLCLGMLLEAYFLNVKSVKEAADLMLSTSQESSCIFDKNSIV